MTDLFSTLIGDLHGMEKTTAKVSPCDVQSSKSDKSGENIAKLKSCGTEASKSVAREQSKGERKILLNLNLMTLTGTLRNLQRSWNFMEFPQGNSFLHRNRRSALCGRI